MIIIKFYAKIFNMRVTDTSITAPVYEFITFYICMYDLTNKKVKDIIAAVTFKRDKMLKNIYIYWLAVCPKLLSICEKNPAFESFGGTYHRMGFSKLLIMSIIKYCFVNNTEKTNLYLQCSGNSRDAVSFYTNNGFYSNPNDINLIPKWAQPKPEYWVREDQISLMICKHGYFNCKKTTKTLSLIHI